MRGIVIVTMGALGLAVILGGTAPLGRALLALGVPGLAVPLFQDAHWRGVAQFRAGDYEAAVASFTAGGDWFNLGNAQAHHAEYAAALEAYDLAIARGDRGAQANYDLVAAFYAGLAIDPDALIKLEARGEGPQADSFIARGTARASGSGSEVNNATTMMGQLQLNSRGRLGVRQIFDDKFMVADERWLQQLSDVPGEFMAARIAQEYKRRVKLGIAPPPAEDPE